eukprot:CAMPEP_0201894628 /NCGR_PEP_ID=MMETSP0902-20130614/41096_1 /ASSEMBLY_ACC=CAM_ASM_000551 /TAXON_ID=420261 /ORGANISM="Thalassiosira antarctica, Strain CCMP982" /LENGTH=263 /DNA_ID=CAMNT_0048426721 /DNA_START=34 /DNA_END=822 /DNA_ORIENTATION=+
MNSSQYNANTDVQKEVHGMPWIDSDGDTGLYSGDVNSFNIPNGVGQMKYDDGPLVKGRWKEGEMVIEEEEDTDINRQQSPNTNNAASSDDEESKQRTLQQFHERNQQFLQSTQNGQYQQQQSQEEEDNHLVEMEQLHQEIYHLQEQVGQLSNGLRITQDTHQLSKDQSRAELTMLHTELDRQNSRHEQIVASLRNRLVESEMARMKMQEQLSSRMEEDAQRDEELKARWKEMTTRVLEDKKWVDEQMNYWKESMEEHRRRLSG